MTAPRHVTVCVCTFRRQQLLYKLLQALGAQQTGGAFTHSVVVIDNDSMRSGEGAVLQFRRTTELDVVYDVEPLQNIPMARNKAVELATGEFVAFIDDDEIPGPDWLATLVSACDRFEVDGVLGPVKPMFETAPPDWVVKGKFYQRATYPTGFRIDWTKGRTGNVLLKRSLFAELVPPFRPEFVTGEDQDFFARSIAKGHSFVWCAEAVAFEVVPPVRWRRSFMVKRALLCGAVSRERPTHGSFDVVKSLVAVPVYTVMLPIALAMGQHTLMDLVIRLCDHVGRLLATVGVRPIRQPYVTE
jgi:glycosyltransferase involved in cell wall biosynthesis